MLSAEDLPIDCGSGSKLKLMKISTETAESNFTSFGVAVRRRGDSGLLVHNHFTGKQSFNSDILSRESPAWVFKL